MGLCFRVGCSWQDHAALYCEVLRALLASEHPVYVTKGTFRMDELQKCAPSSGLAQDLRGGE